VSEDLRPLRKRLLEAQTPSTDQHHGANANAVGTYSLDVIRRIACRIPEDVGLNRSGLSVFIYGRHGVSCLGPAPTLKGEVEQLDSTASSAVGILSFTPCERLTCPDQGNAVVSAARKDLADRRVGLFPSFGEF
jgi:hypothetical protein